MVDSSADVQARKERFLEKAGAEFDREEANKGVGFFSSIGEKFEKTFLPSADKHGLLEFDIMREENGFVEVLPMGMFYLSIVMWIFLIVSVPLLWYTQQKFYRRLPGSDQSGDNKSWYDISTAMMSVSMFFLGVLALLYLRNYGKKSFDASRTNVARLGAKINSRVYADASGKAFYKHANQSLKTLADSATAATNAGLADFHRGEADRAESNQRSYEQAGLPDVPGGPNSELQSRLNALRGVDSD